MTTPFDFESLLDALRDSITPAAVTDIRSFLSTRAKTVVEALPDTQLPDALAAWQREGELLFAQRRWPEAQMHYADLAQVLGPHAVELSLWCRGAAAECLVEQGDLMHGIANLAEVLTSLEAMEHEAGVAALESMIGDAVGRLEASGAGIPDLSDSF